MSGTGRSAAPAPFLLGLAGGSGSGKTTLARRLAATLGPERSALVCEDAYYRDRAALPVSARAELNYDVPDAFDHALLLDHLAALRRGHAVRPPRYSFETHCRVGAGDAVLPRDIVIVEGLLILHDGGIRALLDLAIYVEAPPPVRLARRVARDTVERGRTEASVLWQFETTVAPAHDAYVAPTRDRADLVLLNVGPPDTAVAVLAQLVRREADERAPVTERTVA